MTEIISPVRTFHDFKELKRYVEENDGVVTVTMEQLRDAHGAGRLGIHVRQAIADALTSEGLRFVAEPLWTARNELPDDRAYEVRIYQPGTPVAKLIEASQQPGAKFDEVLRDVTSGEDSRILARVRELVCA